MKQRAKDGERYFFINEYGEIWSDIERHLFEDNWRHKAGNYFLSWENAETARTRSKEIYLQLQ